MQRQSGVDVLPFCSLYLKINTATRGRGRGGGGRRYPKLKGLVNVSTSFTADCSSRLPSSNLLCTSSAMAASLVLHVYRFRCETCPSATLTFAAVLLSLHWHTVHEFTLYLCEGQKDRELQKFRLSTLATRQTIPQGVPLRLVVGLYPPTAAVSVGGQLLCCCFMYCGFAFFSFFALGRDTQK